MKFDLVDDFILEKTKRSVVIVGRELGPEGMEKHYFVISDFYPYMGVPWNERFNYDNSSVIIKIDNTSDIFGKKIAKIIVDRIDHIKYIKDKYSTTYEASTLLNNIIKVDLKILSGFEIKKIIGSCFSCIIKSKKIKGTCFSCKKNNKICFKCSRNSDIKYHKILYKDIIGF